MVQGTNTFVGELVVLRSQYFAQLTTKLCVVLPHALYCACLAMLPDVVSPAGRPALVCQVVAGVFFLLDVMYLVLVLGPLLKRPALTPLLPPI